jgi:lysozyme
MYYDSEGYPTTGRGHLINQVTEAYLMTKVLTNAEVEELFQKDIQKYEDCVQDACGAFIFSTYKNDALVSICYNIGEHGFKNSTFVKRILAMESDDRIVAAIMQWTKNHSLIGRRSVEARLFETGDYDTTAKSYLDWTYRKG